MGTGRVLIQVPNSGAPGELDGTTWTSETTEPQVRTRASTSRHPRRQAVLLIGGDKTGQWSAWYEKAIPLADDLFDHYLDETGQR